MTSPGGGLIVYFRGTPGGSFLQWNIGGPRGKHALVDFQGRHSTENRVVAETSGGIADDRWYDVRVDLEGPMVRCYLDGDLVHEASVEPLTLPQLYAVAGLNADRDEVILKAVHVGDESMVAKLEVADVAVGQTARVVELTGDPDAVNSLEHPRHVAPKARQLPVTDKLFDYQFPPHSLTILRIPVK